VAVTAGSREVPGRKPVTREIIIIIITIRAIISITI
jgi:hypothetical protein